MMAAAAAAAAAAAEGWVVVQMVVAMQGVAKMAVAAEVEGTEQVVTE